MRTFYAVLLCGILGAVGIFALENSATTTFTFFKQSISSSTSLMIAGIFALGMVSGCIAVGFVARLLRPTS